MLNDMWFETDEDASWRAEVRAFLAAELPPEEAFEVEYSEDEARWEFAWDFSRRVAERGWIGLSWPTEYGGAGAPAAHQAIMLEEFAFHNAPLINNIGWSLAAGTLLSAGTDEQKARFLPPIADMTTLWAEGLTEPDAGSDLASLRTTARRDGDDWVINGQKTYTTWGTRADVLYLAARTDPDASRHRGISIFCLDLHLPGISFAPLMNIAGGRQNHTYLDDVRVGPDMLIGEEGRGWDAIMRSFYDTGPMVFPHAMHRRMLEEVTAWCGTQERDGRELLDDPSVRHALAELAVIVECEELLSRQSLGSFLRGRERDYAGALEAVVYKESKPRFAQLVTDIVGPLAQLRVGALGAPLDGEVPEWYLQSFGNHAGGTSQVKRMVLATRGLGLPR